MSCRDYPPSRETAREVCVCGHAHGRHVPGWNICADCTCEGYRANDWLARQFAHERVCWRQEAVGGAELHGPLITTVRDGRAVRVCADCGEDAPGGTP